MQMTFMDSDGTSNPSLVTITVPRCEILSSRALSAACCLAVDEKVILAQIKEHRIMCFLEGPTLILTRFKNLDQIVAYRLPKDAEKTLVFVFMHRRMEEQVWKAFGVPLIGSISGDDIKGSNVRDLYFKLLDPFITKQGDIHHQDNSGSQDFVAEGTNPDSDMESEFYTTDEKGEVKDSKLEMTEVIKEDLPNRFYVNVHWPKKWSELHSNAFEVISPLLLRCGSAETLSLYRCLERYLEEETVS
ncbi:hypothetical protein Droror1_Dr00004173 [Drosera rotundifolia]